MTDKRKNIVLRFGIVYIIICLSFFLVLYRIIVIQFVERDKWMALAAKNVKSNIVVKPNRGNIYACDGRLMASSIPTYYVYMDLRVPALHEKNGILFKSNIDSLSMYLSSFFRDRSPYQYKAELTRAYRQGDGEFKLFPNRISYEQLKLLKTLPLFRLGRNKSGLITKELFRRVRPFGSLASRTIGDIYADESKGGKNGIEMSFNVNLRGTPGVSIRQKVANKYMETVQVEPVDGMDITTTIDIDLQDIAESALLDGVKKFDAAVGYAILMEVKTGEVKAIVNMQRNKDGSYTENRNGAVSDMVEPGSTFKVASLMAALDDGKVRITDTVDTYNGQFKFGDRTMTDHNANHGGYHRITLAQAIYGSSNIGISRAIVKAYGHNPAAFVNKLYEMKLNEKMNIEIPGAAAPFIRHPNDKSHEWSSTTLPWMSVGYETQIPPIYTLAFYNAIANDGKLIRPFFVKSVSKNGQIIKEFTTEVINPSICKPTTLRDIRYTLLGVVEDKLGTAQCVHSEYVRIAGKSGTAQISQGKGGYKAGGTKHQVAFCGYFPYENPTYSCIVVMREPGIGYASGGTMTGSVFKNIAERVIALNSNRKPSHVDTDSIVENDFMPKTKVGYYKAIQTVMNALKLPLDNHSKDWVKPIATEKQTRVEPIAVTKNAVPNLIGMGLKDAVYVLENLGLNVQVQGRGKVFSQNIKPGTVARKGSLILINLQ
ncbi:Peptidoglycan glycosyltransferase [Paludibacter propionicigenes WB4]|uniref:Peptidoglycan glycosyltransferase n=1 Tax=Paludibacter propionicigenes (strain DSM 17365 / JCM 13257 / WB4) TaxID=694427 RepID=E4T4K6_PALPW|nr:penicillin-binding protein [Paludibacter propionicigenes]ADQ79650.1 Peptidoglycan glycosyltransferase [Paludibacter propionicigenes WB4]